MTQDNSAKDRPRKFVQALAAMIEKDSSARARFNRNAGKTLAESHNVLDLFYRIRPDDLFSMQEELYFIVATLYHPDTVKNGEGYSDFGTAVRAIRTENNASGLDKRFAVLLDADVDQLSFRLRQLVKRIKAEKAEKAHSIDWGTLLYHLTQWDHQDRWVQQQWAKSYFVGLSAESHSHSTDQQEETQGA